MGRKAERDAMVGALTADIGGRAPLRDPKVIEALRTIPRHCFVPQAMSDHAYEDRALPIGEGQTISQPYVVGSMTEALELEPTHKVLEIGTGCGYQTAVLARIAQEVFSIEYHPALADTAAKRLHALGIENVRIRCGDGAEGWSTGSVFDRIIVTCCVPDIPPKLLDQLALGGQMVIPVGTEQEQQLERICKTRGGLRREHLFPVRFVPLLGKSGWK